MLLPKLLIIISTVYLLVLHRRIFYLRFCLPYELILILALWFRALEPWLFMPFETILTLALYISVINTEIHKRLSPESPFHLVFRLKHLWHIMCILPRIQTRALVI